MGKVKKRTEKAASKPPAKKAAKAKPTVLPTDAEYISLFNTCVVDKSHLTEVDRIIDNVIVPNKSRYQTVASQSSAPESIFDPPDGNDLYENPLLGSLQGALRPTGGMPSLADLSTQYIIPSLLRNAPPVPQLGPGGTTFPSLRNTGAPFQQPGLQQGVNNVLGQTDPFSLLNNPLAPQGQFPWSGLGGGLLLGPVAGRRIPWYVVAVIHSMEGSSNFKTHLHNGDPLSDYTKQVPANRPQVGHKPPFTWEESAVDSMKTVEHFDRITHWSLPIMLRTLEKYNGTGYATRHTNTPYLWAYSNHYVKGKYASDRKYDPNLVSKQCGAGVILKRMEDRAIIYVPRW